MFDAKYNGVRQHPVLRVGGSEAQDTVRPSLKQNKNEEEKPIKSKQRWGENSTKSKTKQNKSTKQAVS